MDPIGCGQMGRQLGQVGAFMLEGFSGNQPRLALGFVIHSHRGPRQRLGVDVLQTLESAAGQEVGFHRPEAPLFAGLAVAMLDFVAAEDKAILFGEGLHLRDDQRVGSGAPQSCQVGVVDDALASGVAPEHQPLVKEALHFEAIKGAVKLEITPLAIAQVDQAGDQRDAPARQLDLVETGVVLHLQTRLIRHSVAALPLGLADAQLAQPPRQGGISHRDAFFLHQLFIHAHHPTLALLIKPPQQLFIEPLLSRAHWLAASCPLAG